MHGEYPVLYQVEVGVKPLPFQIGLITVPADADHFVIRYVHNGLDVRQQRSACPMDLQANLHAVRVSVLTQFAQCPSDLLKRLLLRNFLRKPIGPDLYSRCSHIVSQLDILFAGGDIVPELFLIRRVIIECAAQAH